MSVNMEQFKKAVRGVAGVMVTPMSKDFSVDYDRLRELTRFITTDLTARDGFLIPGGSTAECDLLTTEERKKVLKIVLEEAKGKIPVIAGCNHSSYREVIDLARFSQENGAVGVMVIPSYYRVFKPDQVFEFYSKIASSVEMGILVYNNLEVTGIDMDVTLLKRLADLPNIGAIKECTPSLTKLDLVVQTFKGRLAVIAGSENYEPFADLMGAAGFISSIINFNPKLSISLWRSLCEKNYAKATEVHDSQGGVYSVVRELLSMQSGGQIVAFKEAMNQVVFGDHAVVRPPLFPMTGPQQERMRIALKAMPLCDQTKIR